MDPDIARLNRQGRTVDELGGRIARRELQAGALLRPEELAQEFGVSRTIIREAFRTLETLGMIRARARVGTIVRPSADWNLLDARVIGWRDTGPDAAAQLRELTILREAIEPTSAGLAAVRASDRELERLGELFRELASALAARDADAFAKVDASFHRVIVETSRSEVLQRLLATLEATLESRYSHRLPVFSEMSFESLSRHRDLVEALHDRDGERAAGVMRRLIRESQEELFRIEGGDDPLTPTKIVGKSTSPCPRTGLASKRRSREYPPHGGCPNP